jgi:hypothetical protein
MSFHTKTFVDEHSMFTCILRIFYPIFLIFFNTFKLYFHNRSICSYEPKPLTPTHVNNRVPCVSSWLHGNMHLGKPDRRSSMVIV